MVSVDHVTHSLQYDRSKSSGILRSLCSLLFVITVYWSLLKQQDLDTVIIIKRFFTVCTYKLVPSALPALRLLGAASCDTGDQTIPQNKMLGCFHFHFSVFAVGYYDIFQSLHLILSAFLSCQMDTRACAKSSLLILTVIIKPSFVFHASMTRVCIAFVMASKRVVFLCYLTKL